LNLPEVALPGGFPIWATLTLGFVLGLRHALDADHIAAVSTFVTERVARTIGFMVRGFSPVIAPTFR
jgi:high-affinity nickel permease